MPRPWIWAGTCVLALCSESIWAEAVQAAVEATLEAQEVMPAGAAGGSDGVFRLRVTGLQSDAAAVALRSDVTPVFQVVALPAEALPAAGADSGRTARAWTFLGRYRGRIPSRFVLVAESSQTPLRLRELASVEPKLLTRAEGAEQLREQWIRARLDRLRREILASEEQGGFWRYQEAYLQHRLHGTDWAPPAQAPWRPTRPTGLMGSLELVTGMSAVEESLQLSVLRDAVAAETRAAPAADVPVASLQPPQIRSHDFADLQRGLAPGPIPETSRFAPEDALYLGFDSLAKALEVVDQVDLWQKALSRLSDLLYTEDTSGSFIRRLGLKLNPELRPFYGLAAGALALVLDDPYLAEGAELTLIIEARSETLLDLRVAQFDEAVLREHPGVSIRETEHGTHSIRILHSADGSIRSYRCAAGKYRLFSTSLGALHRVLDAWDGHLPRLADAHDFRYVRSVLPGGDGFIYFSDACVRRFVSPAFKLAELRRVRCLANLRVLDAAADLSDLEQSPTRTVQGLLEAGYLAGEPRCPQGGVRDYGYDEAAGRFRCAVHGTAADLARLSEAPVDQATPEEAEAYKAFVENYQQYWPRYFDPIGIEVTLSADRMRLATCILPLIESSAYRQLQELAGGTPRRLGYGRGAFGQLGSVLSFKLTPFDGYRSDLSHIPEEESRELLLAARRSFENWIPWDTTKDVFSWIGPEAGLVLLDSEADSLENLSRSVGAARITVVDAELAIHLLRRLARFRPGIFDEVQTPGSSERVRLRLTGGHWLADLECVVTDDSMYWIWGEPEQRRNFLQRLLALVPSAGSASEARAENVFFGLNLAQLPKARGVTLRGAEAMHRVRCLRNLAKLEDLSSFEAFRAETPATVVARTRSVAGIVCPDLGTYTQDGELVRCSVHGSRRLPAALDAPPESAPLRQLLERMGWLTASLTFTPEGIRTHVELPAVAAR